MGKSWIMAALLREEIPEIIRALQKLHIELTERRRFACFLNSRQAKPILLSQEEFEKLMEHLDQEERAPAKMKLPIKKTV